MKTLSLFLTSLIVIASCSRNPELKIQFDDAGGLSTESVVKANGIKIGKVVELSLNEKYKVIARLELDRELPDDSKFYLAKTNLLESTGIEVKQGTSKSKFKNGETVVGQVNKSSSIMDTLLPKAVQFLNNSSSSRDRQDSVLIELRKLNDHLEQLKSRK